MKKISTVVAVRKKNGKIKVHNKLDELVESAEPSVTFRQVVQLVSRAVEQVENSYLKDGDEILSVSHSIF